MTPSFRKILAGLSACAIALSVFAYVYSFFSARVDKILPWAVILFLGWMVLTVPIYLVEYPASKAWNWQLKEWARGMPSWVAPCSWLLGLVAVAHFFWSAVQIWPGVPEIVDGQYVLGSGGRMLEILTRAEYLRLMEGILRALATIMISLYFVPMMYWWFRQDHRRQSEMLPSSNLPQSPSETTGAL
jgi:hypothetical protein